MLKSVKRRNRAMYCVVVGDIVNSKKIDPDTDIRKRVTTALQHAFDRINTDYIGSLMTTFGMVRGDAFEGVMLTQYHAPKIIQDIIKAAYSVEKTAIRISVVLGQLTVTSDDRNVVDGPAFHTAFANLEKLKMRESSHWLQVSFDIGSLAKSLVDSHIALLTALTEGWTERQREVVWAMERYSGSQKLVGKQLNIPPSVVSKQLKAANYEAYRQAWEGLTDYLINIDEYTTTDKSIVEKSYVPYFNMGLYELENKANFTAAISHFKVALEIAKDELEENDPLLIPIYNKLARAYYFNGNPNEAGKFINMSMQLQEKMPKMRIHYAEALLIKADLSCDVKDYSTAKELFETALNIACNTLGDNHPLVADILNSFAIMYEDINEYEKALENYEKALSIDKKAINEIPPTSYATTLNNIADCYYETGNYEKALSYGNESLLIFENNLPPKHEYIKDTQLLLSHIKAQLEASKA